MTELISLVMAGIQVPRRVREWTISQSGVFIAADLAADVGISPSTASQYLSRLAKRGDITRLVRGRYLSHEPAVPESLTRVVSALSREMPFTDLVVWSTEGIAHFTHSVPPRSLAFVETPKENVPSVRAVLEEEGLFLVTIPSPRDLAEVFHRGTEVFLMARRDRYATVPLKGRLRMSTLERVLVDVYFLARRRELPIPVEDLLDAMRAAVDGGAVDVRVLRRNAMRRHVDKELASILKE